MDRARRPGRQPAQPERLIARHRRRRAAADRCQRRGLVRAPGRDHRLPLQHVRDVSVLGGGRDRARPRRSCIRPRESDAGRSTRRTSSGATSRAISSWRTSCASVRYGDSLTVAAWQHIWLNEGFANVCRVALDRARRVRDRPGAVRRPVLRDPRRRPVLVRDDRRSGPRRAPRFRGVLPRRDDAPPASAGRGRRRLLHDPPSLEPAKTQRRPTTSRPASSSRSRSRSRGRIWTRRSRPGSSPPGSPS